MEKGLVLGGLLQLLVVFWEALLKEERGSHIRNVSNETEKEIISRFWLNLSYLRALVVEVAAMEGACAV